MNLSVAISPCPNDTFSFAGLINKQVCNNQLKCTYHLADIEALNKSAINNEFDIVKISFHTYPYIADTYEILPVGSALGYKNGPLLISKNKIYPDEVKDLKIAIPGKLTTAYLLLKIFYDNPINTNEYIFSDIISAVMDNECDAGLLIHESRFTYNIHNLKLISDIGETWHNKTTLPLPLGCIVIKRTISKNIKNIFTKCLLNSILHAKKSPSEYKNFIQKNAQELSWEVALKHINTYVNEFTLDLGDTGKKAITKLFNIAESNMSIPKIKTNMFFD